MTTTSDGSDMVGCPQNPCEYIADVLGLELPRHVDPVRAIEMDIRRLLQTEERWSEACAIARVHCPAGVGESHVRQGIPALAARCHKAEERILLLEAQLAERNALCFDHRGDFAVTCRECEEHRAAYKRMRELESKT
jgi:hypothetical protein